MKINVITGKRRPGEEPEVVIYCSEENQEISRLVKLIQSMDIRITGCNENVSCRLRQEDIYYFEAVDGKVFAYLEKEVWQVSHSLESLERLLKAGRGSSFFRISKSCIINLNHVEHLTSMMGNRIIARMENGEDVIISRHYAGIFRDYLKYGRCADDSEM